MSGRKITVALVDDDPSLCRAVTRLLHAAGMESMVYPSAESFLERRGQDSADCVLLDIQLGGISGFELQKRLLAEAAAPPIVFLTAYDEPESREEAHRLGCSAYLLKTDPGQVVLEAIRAALRAPAIGTMAPAAAVLQ